MRFTHASIPFTRLAIALTSLFDSTLSISAKFECDPQAALQVALDRQAVAFTGTGSDAADTNGIDLALASRVLLPLRQRVSELTMAFSDAERVTSTLLLMAPPSTVQNGIFVFEILFS